MPRVAPPPKPKKGKRVPPMLRRTRALDSIQAKFGNKPFVPGRYDCAKLTRALLVAMGHARLPKPKPYSTALGARRELKRLGYNSLEEMMDAQLERIPPASMLPGDIALMDADPEDPAGPDGLFPYLGMGKYLGWHPEHATLAHLVPPPELIKGAWRS